ncbi:MAG: dynamin family protein [Ignavibacteriales bacterium]|nr:GTPase Era [Ignavibacteriaceae bacterium]QOJ28316.1 MAG: dynamin family protein [Ignavibacteriales bacterium]
MDSINYTTAFNLVSKIVQNGEGESFLQDIAGLNKIINTDLPEAMKDYAPSNFAEIYSDFKYTFEKFTDFILFDKLIGKNTVTLGGGFSTGKSSFINALLKNRMLPSEIDPSTSVPTYVIHGAKESAIGINVFNKKVDLAIEELKIISHGFTSEYNVKFGHLLETIFVETPEQPFKSISFLDTPGYSKPESENYSKKTDENIARTQLNSANFILWFVSAEEGTITDEDIKFLQSLNSGIPFAVIVNKSDKRAESDVSDIVGLVKQNLTNRGIFPLDVIPFSCRYPEKFGKEQIQKLLANWNKQEYASTFARDFKILFVECIEYFEEQIRNESRRLNWINTGMTFSDIPEVNEAFTNLSNEIKIFLKNYRDKEKNLKEIKDLFFKEIKSVADKYGIEMPEPSELDLLSFKSLDIFNLVRKNKDKRGIKTGDYFHILQNQLTELQKNEEILVWGQKYSKIIEDTITEQLVIEDGALNMHVSSSGSIRSNLGGNFLPVEENNKLFTQTIRKNLRNTINRQNQKEY